MARGLRLDNLDAVIAYADFVRASYAAAESVVLKILSTAVAEGIDMPEWAAEKAAAIGEFRKRVLREVSFLSRVPDVVERGVHTAYRESVRRTVRLLRDQNLLSPVFKRNIMTGSSLKALAIEKVQPLKEAYTQILRAAEDAYRQVVGNAVAVELAYGGNRVQAAATVLRELADRGIGNFIDSAGRRWEIESYAEMATRSAVMRAAAEGNIQTLYSSGFDTVIVSAGSESCPLCAPWEGRILSISGRSQDYPQVAEALEAGLLHPNCTHTLDPYIEGLTEPAPQEPEPVRARRYRERQTQRYLERNLRRWRRREAAAITPEERKQASARVKEWRDRLKTFTDETGRKRWRERESPGRPR